MRKKAVSAMKASRKTCGVCELGAGHAHEGDKRRERVHCALREARPGHAPGKRKSCFATSAQISFSRGPASACWPDINRRESLRTPTRCW